MNIIKHGQMFNRIHVRDIASITALALAQGLVGAYNIVDGAPSSSESVNNYAAHKMGLPDLPEVPFEVAEMSPMARSFYATNRIVSNAAIVRALGYKFIYPDYRAGLDAMWEDAKSDSNAD